MHTSQHPPESNHYRTDSIFLASFIVSVRAMEFLRAEANGDGRVHFIFSDPENRSERVELDFETGAKVSGKSLLEAEAFIRRQLRKHLGSNNTQNNKSQDIRTRNGSQN